MEQQLPAAPWSFELPVVDFPEGGIANRMLPYESMRPYFSPHHLRFSTEPAKGAVGFVQRDVERRPRRDDLDFGTLWL